MDPTPPLAFRSHHGRYLNAAYGGGAEGASENGIPLGLLTARAEAAGADEQFTVEPLAGDEYEGSIAIRAAHGQYVCAEGGGHGLVIANRAYEAPGPWETFAYEVVDDEAGLVALRAHDGAYLTAEADGSIVADRVYDSPGPWETWHVEPGPPYWWTPPPEPEVEPPPVGEIPPPGGLANREPAGPVRLTSGRVCTDDRGSWLARGHSFFYVSRAWRDDRADRYERNMAWLARYGHTFYRGFASVGGWPDPDGWHNARTYPEWALEMLPQWLVDAFDRFRLRCSLTLFDGEVQYRDDHAQDSFVQGVCDRIRPILHTIQDVQVANEYGPTKWDYPAGVERLKRHARHLRAELGPHVLISLSSRNYAMADSGISESDVYGECHKLFDGLLPDIVNVSCNHDSRDTTKVDKNWRHVRQGWERVVTDPHGVQLEPDASIDDEPMGPRSSVAEETSPSLIVGKGLVDFVAGRHQRCDHSDAGIWSDWLLDHYKDGFKGAHKYLEDHPANTAAAAAWLNLEPLLPPHLSIWPRTRHGFADHPFAASFQLGHTSSGANGFTQIWPDGITAHGCVRFYCGLNGREFIGPITGVKDRLELKWAAPMSFTIYTCKDGEPWHTVTASGPGTLTVPASVDTDYLVIGRFV